MHCSANTDMNGETPPSSSSACPAPARPPSPPTPKRLLIGDDEHGWDDNGVFNFEGRLPSRHQPSTKRSPEPDIYNAIKQRAAGERHAFDKDGKIDFADKSVTENKMFPTPSTTLRRSSARFRSRRRTSSSCPLTHSAFCLPSPS